MTSRDDIHPECRGAIWFHGRPSMTVDFDQDRPAFFASRRADVELFAGRFGHVISAEVDVRNPINDLGLLLLAEEMGLDDVYDEDYDGVPDVSDYLYEAGMRERLDRLGYDGYIGSDAYLYVVIVWNPSQIRIVSQEPFMIAGTEDAFVSPTP